MRKWWKEVKVTASDPPADSTTSGCQERIPETQLKSMPDRVQAVIETKGWQASYLGPVVKGGRGGSGEVQVVVRAE